MKVLAFFALVVSLAIAVPASAAANPVGDLVYANVRFEVPPTDLIPGIAALRASCDVNASGEHIALLANESSRATIGASAGPCTIVVTLVGVDVALPVFNTTPLGRSSFYLPGISTVTLGLVDLSVDLVTSLKTTSRVPDGIATIAPTENTWPSWGVARLAVDAMDGVGSVAASELNTTFVYAMSLALTVYAFSIAIYRLDLVQIGSFAGTPSLVSPLTVDLRPHTLTLNAASDVGYDHATLSWGGTVDPDIDRLELWLTDGSANVSYGLSATATETRVSLRPAIHYEARIVSVDRAGQTAVSAAVGFDTPAAPAPPSSQAVEAQGSPVFTATLTALAILAGVVGYAAGFLRGREGD